MNNRFVINYTPGPTFFHRLSGFTKVFLFLAMTAAIIASFDIRIIVPLIIINVLEIISMKPNYKPIVIMFLITFFTVTVIGDLMLLFVTPEAGLNNVGAETIIWQSGGRLYLSKEILWYMLIIFLKRTASFATVIAFALSTTPSEFASGLCKCGLPYKVSTIVSLAYRTIPNIAEDFINIRNSMMMRGMELEGKKVSLMQKLKNYVLFLVPLIFTSFGKVGSIANAMDLRSYGKMKKRTYYAENEATKADKIVRAFAVILLLAALYYIVMYRWINPWPAKIWAPWLSREEVIHIDTLDTLFIMKWFKK